MEHGDGLTPCLFARMFLPRRNPLSRQENCSFLWWTKALRGEFRRETWLCVTICACNNPGRLLLLSVLTFIIGLKWGMWKNERYRTNWAAATTNNDFQDGWFYAACIMHRVPYMWYTPLSTRVSKSKHWRASQVLTKCLVFFFWQVWINQAPQIPPNYHQQTYLLRHWGRMPNFPKGHSVFIYFRLWFSVFLPCVRSRRSGLEKRIGGTDAWWGEF